MFQQNSEQLPGVKKYTPTSRLDFTSDRDMTNDLYLPVFQSMEDSKDKTSVEKYLISEGILAGSPDYSVGSTEATGMCFGVDDQRDLNKRSASKLVSEVVRFATNGLDLVSRYEPGDMGGKTPTIRLVESLVWPFVARRSRRSTWFSDKEFRRFKMSMRETATRIEKYVSDENLEQTFIKYWLDYYLWQGFKDANPPERDPKILTPLFSGWCKRAVARAIAKGDFSFLYSLQKGAKQSWPPLGEIKKMESYLKHMQRLSTPKSGLPSDLRKMIERESKTIFRNTNDSKRIYSLGSKFMPSGSACLQASRREGGALSLVSKFTYPWDVEESKKIGLLPVLVTSLNEWRQTEYTKVFETLVDNVLHSSSDDPTPLYVDIVALAEPAKFRIISKGDGYLYTSLQPVQGLMIGDWKKSYASTMLTPDLTDRVNEIANELTELPFWCSADYSAATDLLKKESSMAVLEPLENLPLKNLCEFAMIGAVARYPNGMEVYASEGQLMGHPLSFPLLCCINLSVYHCAINRWIESSKGKKELKNRKRLGRKMWRMVIVNGDDMLFKCDQSFYEIFKETASDAGFQLSTGKNYLSTRAAMINSQLFVVKPNNKMKRVGYLNQRLLKGNNIKQDSSATPVQIATSTNEMLQFCPWAACSIPEIMSRWKSDWFGRYSPNWYVPAHLGGMGIDRQYAPLDFKITKSQRELAARFVSDPRMALYRMKGIDIPTAKFAGALAHWRMVPGAYVQTDSESLALSDKWMERIAYAARAHHGSKEVSDKVFISKFKPQYRLKPMSSQGLELYWEAQVFASKLPSCPPISKIKLPQFLRRPHEPNSWPRVESSEVTAARYEVLPFFDELKLAIEKNL